MTVTSKLFRAIPPSLPAAKENWTSDAIKMALVTHGWQYTLDQKGSDDA